MFDTLGDEVTGRNAVAVQRKKMTGKDRENIEDRERKEREAKKQQELEEKYKVWNRGVRQVKQVDCYTGTPIFDDCYWALCW